MHSFAIVEVSLPEPFSKVPLFSRYDEPEEEVGDHGHTRERP
jgi:hypothetical protein